MASQPWSITPASSRAGPSRASRQPAMLRLLYSHSSARSFSGVAALIGRAEGDERGE